MPDEAPVTNATFWRVIVCCYIVYKLVFCSVRAVARRFFDLAHCSLKHGGGGGMTK